MEYAGSYALFNYRLSDPSLGMNYSNLRLIRAFEHGLDPTSSEAGFVLIHVDMVKNSGRLVEGAVKALSACENDDRKTFAAALQLVIGAMIDVNAVMDGKSSHEVLVLWAILIACARYVEEIQTKQLHELSYIYLRHYETIDVPTWSGL